MISRPTVLVLGAGASVDYNFPTGPQLLRQICNSARHGGELHRFLFEEMLLPEPEINVFVNTLGLSQAPSVDRFIEYRNEFETIGKYAIAATLIPYEDKKRFMIQNERGWYSYLFEFMTQGGKFEGNCLSILTFNYDRSLEAFFLIALCNLYGIKEPEADQWLNYIPIIHLHGSLGERLWKSNLDPHRAYQPELTPAWVKESAEHIKIVHEIKPGEEFKKAQKLLYEAEEVIFLGFGFLPENIDRLGVRQVREWRTQDGKNSGEWYASRIGMGDAEVIRAARLLGGQPHFGGGGLKTITEYLKNTDCLK